MSHEPPASRSQAPPSGSGWVDLTKDRKGSWIANWVVLAVFLGVPLAAAAVPAYNAIAGGDEETAQTFTLVIAFLAVLLLALSAFLLITGPRHLARQGIELDDRGITVVKRAKWWAGGHTAFVPWADVHQVAWGLRRGRNPRRTLDLHLRQVDSTMRLPGWAKVRTDERARPRIIFDSDRKTLVRLEEELSTFRPALSASPEDTAQPAPERRSAQTGTSQWVDMRWQGALGWAVATGFCVYIAIGLTVLTVVAGVSSGDIWGTAALLALAVVFLLLSRFLLRMTPRYATRQGIQVDDTGITLMQEPKWWFPGRKAPIPWAQVSGISQDVIIRHGQDSQKTQYLIDIDLSEPLSDVELPGWAQPDSARIRIKPSKAKHLEAVRALRKSRPDLFPGA